MSSLMELAQVMKGRNAQDIVLTMLKNQKITDPNVVQLIQLLQAGKNMDFNNLAQSIFEANGLNMEDELNNFISLLK